MQFIGRLLILGLVGLVTARAAQHNTQVSLLLSADAAKAGETVLAGVRLQMAPRWHTYWRNPGDSGLATTIAWNLPRGVTAAEIQWPSPTVHTAADLTTYVYYREAVLLVLLTIAPDATPGPLRLSATIEWLECEEACLPGSGKVEATLTVGTETKPSPQAPMLTTWQQRIPKPNPAIHPTARWAQPPAGDTAELIIEGAVADDFRPIDLYPYEGTEGDIRPGATVEPADAGRFRLTKKVNKLDGRFPASIRGLLVGQAAAGEDAKAVEVSLSIGSTARSGGASGAPTPGGSGSAPALSLGGLIGMLGLAFLGGLILNIMPCVLPVIALKVLGFVQQSKEEPARVRRLALVYAGGVVASFLALAAVVVAVQGAGDDASWGMQMQNPVFRVALLVVVTLVALNLFGVFEISLAGGALDGAARLASKQGYSGAFFNGVLMTALATPCTAPFLTTALGFAFLLKSAGIIVLTFVVIALGLALPYVLLSWRPDWLRFLPKPGVWMQRFKVAMGFPMLATAIWLFDVAAPGYGDGGVLWLGLFLAIVALVAWIWGEFVQRGSRGRTSAMAVCVALLTTAYFYVLESQLRWRQPPIALAAGGVIRDSPDGLEWHPWSREAVDQARAAGKVVLVDFTAKWCLTCKSNKKFAIDIASVREQLKAVDGIAMRADYTNRDPRIAEELKRHGRAAVPTVVVFPKEASQAPVVLPTVLTPGIVLDALRQAAG